MIHLSLFSATQTQEAFDARIELLMDDPSISDWLKNALKTALQRDPVDAANDAEVLSEILANRCGLLFHGNHGSGC